MLWPIQPGASVVSTLEARRIFDFDDIAEEHEEWTPEARAAYNVAQDDVTGETNPYLVMLEMIDKKYDGVNCKSTVNEIAEWFAT